MMKTMSKSEIKFLNLFSCKNIIQTTHKSFSKEETYPIIILKNIYKRFQQIYEKRTILNI